MKKMIRFFVVILLLLYSVFPVSAQQNEENLTIIMVNPLNPQTVEVTFSEAVDVSSVRATIENQMNRSLIKVKDYKSAMSTENSVENFTSRVLVSLDEVLMTSTAYKIVINSVISQKGNTIQDGVDAIRDFVTPARFLEDSVDLMAPSNPTATVIGTEKPTTETQNTSNTENVKLPEKVIETSSNAKALPEAGAETVGLITIVLIVIMFFALVFRRKRA